MSGFLAVQGPRIIDGRTPVTLKGVNLGGWLMMEGYILHAPNAAERLFKKDFAKRLGAKRLREFERDFRDNFVSEEDLRRIARMGLNCIRLPFNARLLEKDPFKYDARGFQVLDAFLRRARKHGIRVILDMHAACAPQNHDWHSDSLGTADLWTSRKAQDRTAALWERIADRYRDDPTVAGYDLLNESVVHDPQPLNKFYNRLIRTIRGVDKKHILFIEGNRWGQDIEHLEDFEDDNWALSIHYYEPLEFTFNFVPQMTFPFKGYNEGTVRRRLEGYAKIAAKRDLPVFVGEFGVNSRQGKYGEARWLRTVLTVFKDLDFHWTYWTYKAVKNSIFPDGIFSYYGNPDWVRRHGPRTGWENYAGLWLERRREIVRSWRTEHFVENTSVSSILERFAK